MPATLHCIDLPPLPGYVLSSETAGQKPTPHRRIGSRVQSLAVLPNREEACEMRTDPRMATKADRRTITDHDIVLWGGRYAPILQNAARLLDDASVLRRETRLASATALAILSLEETGKFALCHECFRGTISRPKRRGPNSPFSHREKQRAAGQVVSGVMGAPEIMALVNLAGFRMAIVPQESDAPRKPTAEDIISGIKDDRIDELIKNSDFGPHLKFLVHLMKGRYDDLKQQCFYVDENRSDGTLVGAGSVGRAACDGAMRTAKKAIWATKLALKRHSKYMGQ
jgi:AbiV family abortive infection protein